MSGHWYDQDAIRYDTVPGAKGQPVRPDIRHARKLNLAPGVTTIIRAAASEPFVRWREERVLSVAQTLPRAADEAEADYIARILRHPTILAVLKLLEPLSGERPLHKWQSEAPAVSHYGFATRADLWLPPNFDHAGCLIDIKTKDGDVSEARTYDEHAMQLAATREALGARCLMDRPPCGILFLSRDIPGCSKLVMLDERELDNAWDMFRSLLLFWQRKHAHVPEWATLAINLHDLMMNGR
jgi:hypothetical protein